MTLTTKLPAPACPPAASIAELQATVATRLGPGFAKKHELVAYLQISERNVGSVLAKRGLKPNQAGRFVWTEVWWRLWRIRNVPPEMYAKMKAPLLGNAEVARLLGVHERSIRRDGDRAERRYGLPDHLDLSPRIRRHHPIRIEMWLCGMPLPTWIQPVPAGRKLRLAGRKTSASDNRGSNGQHDEHPFV